MIKKIGLMCSVLSCAAHVSASEGIGQTECVWVDDARIVSRNTPAMRQFGSANRGHQIGPGRHAVIAIRRFDGAQLPPDAQIFVKTTIELTELPPDMKLGREYKLPVIDSFHSEGNSGFVTKGEYHWTVRPVQSVRIRRDKDGLRLHYSQDAIGEHGATKQKRDLVLKADCTLRKTRIEDLSLWHGHPGTNVQSFYPPSPDLM
ncbi:hypothetical protein [Massilia niabensis]|uniref:Uncharacterized protein n=1 Tax=Massilia niabensis TaxID=544910 RepID=A0ABW0L4G5_9BURK